MGARNLAQVATPVPVPVPVPVARPKQQPKQKFNSMAVIAVALGAALIGAVGIGAKLLYDKRQPAPPAPVVTVPDPAAPGDPKQPDPRKKAVVDKPSPTPQDPPRPVNPGAVNPGSADPKPAITPHAGFLAVSIRSTPEGANVVIDDGKVPPCTTPCLLELPNGRHSAAVMLETYKSEMRIFYLPQDTSITVNLEKRMGLLEISSTPQGATVTVDGVEHPQKTPTRFPIVVGKHTVVVSLPGKPSQTQTFEMRSEATITFQPNWSN